MTILLIHFRFGTMYTYFIEISSKYEYLPEKEGYSYIMCLCKRIHIH